MSSPVIPPPLEALRNRPFSFYPAILNIEHNQWQYRKATWNDVLVVNARTGQEIAIPRHYLGEISSIEDPVVVVGLLKELEYRDGAVCPYQRRVIEMPVAVGAWPPVHRPAPAAVVGIRLESKADSSLMRLVGGALVLGIVAGYVAINFYREGLLRPRMSYSAKGASYLALSANDDYQAVVRKLGAPIGDRWRADPAGMQYHGLIYPDRAYTVVLMGAPGRQATYIGTLNAEWVPVHSVQLPQGDTGVLLRNLPRF
ncbi:MAG TPA: hypothetical protein VMT86_11785 [Bryobacteraceae bacterium]|nr:hypothetical protein [Bryobacteraceae bacterium]